MATAGGRWSAALRRRRFLLPAVAAIFLVQATPPSAAAAADPAAERAQALVALAMQAYWTGGDPKAAEALLKGVTLHGRYDVVERAFAEASALEPSRIDLLYDVASTQLLRKDLAGARATYGQILQRDPAAFEAWAWLDALDRIQQNAAAGAGAEQAMSALEPARARRVIGLFDRAEQIMAEPPEPTVRALPGRVTIVTFGYALNPSGGMEKPLLDRLQATLAAARANPGARIVVSGGQPQAGVTEADLMTRWLVQNGVGRDRVQIEDKAKDTVGNALNAAVLMGAAPPDEVLLVTSATHMRRARVLLEAAVGQAGLRAPVIPLAAADGVPGELTAPPSEDERLAIFRDALRVAGLWAYPGLQR
jgi:hypothetical protein